MAGQTSLQKRVRVVCRGHFIYTIVMELSCSEPKPNNVSKPSNKQKETMQKIIRQVRKRQDLDELCRRGTLCTIDDGRLDSQTRVTDMGRANLQFQIGDRSYAVCVLDTFPTEAPLDLKLL